MQPPASLSGFVFTFLRVLGSTVIGRHSAVAVGGEGGVGGLGDFSADESGERVEDAEAYGAPGIVFRPLPPSQTTEGDELAAEALTLRIGGRAMPVAWRDLRLNRAFPNPKAGDVALVGYGSNFLKLGANGTISLATTTDATPNGEMVYLQVKGDGFNLIGPFGKITYGANGFHLLHHTGARLDLGGIGGLPAPLDELGTYATISAAIAKIQATAIVLGPDSGVAEPAAKAIALQTVLAAIGSALSALAAATGAAGALASVTDVDGTRPGLITAFGTAATAMGTAVGAATAAIGGGAATIPSQSTSVT